MTHITTVLCMATISVAIVCAYARKGGLDPGYTSSNTRAQDKLKSWLKEKDRESAKLMNAILNADWDRKLDSGNEEKLKRYRDLCRAYSKYKRVFIAELEDRVRSETMLTLTDDTPRRILLLRMESVYAHNESMTERKLNISTRLDTLYRQAKVCSGKETKGINGGKETNGIKCLSLQPDLMKIMSKSNDVNKLKWAWLAWRNATGPKMRPLYPELVSLQNQAAKDNGYRDEGDYWRQQQFGSTPDIADATEALYKEVKPLYEQLFAYVRRKLMEKYGNESGIVPGGPIPAHLLGDMDGKVWTSLITKGILHPYPEVAPNDVTKEMQRQNYTVEKLFKMAEDFFVSIGLFEMNEGFWNNSVFVKPTNTKTDCAAYAWDFQNGTDFRIKMCAEVDQHSLKVVHHEMGHIEYFMSYTNLSMVYRESANYGFTEAIGELIDLAVNTDTHFKKIGLFTNFTPQANVTDDPRLKEKQEINDLMGKALWMISFLPYGYLVDKWRWDVFNGNITSENYNREWWHLRLKYQGLVPPVKRTERDFDPGAKYHIPSSESYIRYFVAFIIKFQFYEAMCAHTNHTGPLHQCDFYGSKTAGDKLRQMMAMGRSKPWPDAMEVMTGQRKMSSQPIIKYFKPLTDWLKRENAGNDLGWLRPGETVESVIDKYFQN